MIVTYEGLRGSLLSVCSMYFFHELMDVSFEDLRSYPRWLSLSLSLSLLMFIIDISWPPSDTHECLSPHAPAVLPESRNPQIPCICGHRKSYIFRPNFLLIYAVMKSSLPKALAVDISEA